MKYKKTYTQDDIWEDRYNRYLTRVQKLEDKGYIMGRLSKSQFKVQYSGEKKRAEKIGDTKRSIIDKIAKQSVDINKVQQKRISKQLGGFGDGGVDIRKMSRNDYFSMLLLLNEDDYNASRASYNEVFG